MKIEGPEVSLPTFWFWWAAWAMVLVSGVYLGFSPPAIGAPAWWISVWQWVTAMIFVVVAIGTIAIAVISAYSPDRDDSDKHSGPRQYTRAWIGRMSVRVGRVRAKFRQIGAYR